MLITSRAILVAGRGMRRVTAVGRTAGTVALGGIPLLVAAARDAHNLSVGTTIAAILGGAAAGWLVDDAPGEVITPVAIGPTLRRALRAVYVIGAIAATSWALVVGASRLADAPVTMETQVPLMVASASVAVAIATIAHRNGEPAAGAWGVPASTFAVVLVGGLALRWPGWLPTLADGPTFAHWWVVAAIALATVFIAGADPGARRRAWKR